ncbi:MAG: hypothetical protein M0P73_16225, partial [Syntrophobacterales bacterium]|nr:hypothetical protein [Syntrophobacterales bacterium]
MEATFFRVHGPAIGSTIAAFVADYPSWDRLERDWINPDWPPRELLIEEISLASGQVLNHGSLVDWILSHRVRKATARALLDAGVRSVEILQSPEGYSVLLDWKEAAWMLHPEAFCDLVDSWDQPPGARYVWAEDINPDPFPGPINPDP